MNTTACPAHEPIRSWVLALLLVLVVISRIPLLPLGFGSEGDAWRAARAGLVLWTTGQYEISRFPGNPLHEIVLAPIVASRSFVVSNGITLLLTIGMLLEWARLVTLCCRFPLLLTIAFAFSPMVWINSASSTDYIWSLACILAAVHLTLSSRFRVAGILLGLAAGFRPANIIAVIPIATLIIYTNRSWRHVVTVVTFGAATIALTFIPIFDRYGALGWLSALRRQLSNVGLPFPDQLLLSGYRGVFAIGLVPAFVLLLVFVYNRRAFHEALTRRDASVIVSLAGLAAYVLLFLAFPFDRSYLIPALPFLLLLADRVASKRWMAVLTAALISYAFVSIDVIQHHDVRGTPGLNITPGMVIQDWHDRTYLLAERELLPLKVFPRNSIVMTGLEDSFTFLNASLEAVSTLPRIAFQGQVFRSHAHPDLFFVPLLRANELTHLQEEGYSIFCRSEARAYIESIVRYDISAARVSVLPPWEVR